MAEPREIVGALERGVELPSGNEERFVGYGVMGVPFVSEHMLCLRRFPTTSLGQGYTSVWHRNPAGEWIFIQDAPPDRACSRYFGSAVDKSLSGEIKIDWTGPRDFSVTIEGDYSLNWQVSLGQTMATQMANGMGRVIPGALWRNRTVLNLVGAVGGLFLGAGHLSLTGKVPNGQRFVSNPRKVWSVSSSKATWCGQDLGEVGALRAQARIGDLWLPQQGRFFVGSAFLENFDPSRHLQATCREN
jgi:hypothetical protein